MLRASLQMKIGASVATGLLVIIALFGLVGSSMLHQNVQRMMDERLMVAQLTASFLDTELDEQFEQLARVARLAALEVDDRLLEKEGRDLLRHSEPFVTSVFFVERTGHLRWAEPPGHTPRDAELFASLGADLPCDARGRYASGLRSIGDPARPLAVLAVCVVGGPNAGVVGAVVDPDHATIRKLVAATRQLGKTGHAQLVDQDGLVAAASEPHRPFEAAEHPGFVRPLLTKPAPAAAIIAPDDDEDIGRNGQRHAMAFAPLQAVPWGLTVGGSEGELFLEVDRWRWQIAVLSGLALAAALLLVWMATRGVTRSVSALTVASRRIGTGDLATPVPETGDGEVRTLAETLDGMRRHLRDALDALAVETSRYHGIIGAMADAVFSTDRQCRITAFNPSAEALTGRRVEGAVGQNCRAVLRSIEDSGEDCARSCLPECRSAFHASATVAKKVILRSDGRCVPVAHARSAICDSEGAFVGVVHVLRDVSNEERVERLKDEFLSMVSHELRTPLGHIKGYATTLLLPDGPADDETRQRCLRVIVAASDELEELVGNLLDMSKIGAGAFIVEPRPVRMRLLVRAAIERTQLRSSGHKLQMHVPPRLPLVLADGRRIEQVLYNLLDNALKYSPLGGRIVVSADLNAAEVVVSVSDEGIGIPNSELAGLFEPFHRGEAARSKLVGGSGLGLAVCKGIIEAHHGRIWAESPIPGREQTDRKGTVVRFALPTSKGAGRRRKATCGDSRPRVSVGNPDA